jgi:hypothetical protein
MKGWLKFCTSYLAYIQIWLNLSMDDGQFLVHLPIDDHHHIGSLIVEWALSTVQHSLKCPTKFQLSCASNLWITLPTKRIDLLVYPVFGMGRDLMPTYRLSLHPNSKPKVLSFPLLNSGCKIPSPRIFTKNFELVQTSTRFTSISILNN